MYDYLVGADLKETREYKSRYRMFRNYREVSPRSIDRLRGVQGIDGWVFLPGFLALPLDRQNNLRNWLELGRRYPRGDRTRSMMNLLKIADEMRV
ncbi:hypothetical protein SEA_ESTES_137 [Mycobacterium phage Estes]|uniref:Uncharacterized protein n=1 Tax=Mycobacterium phage Estes TaxID=2759459 RepID=A0A7G9A2I6_9CAUD|nr:hypothetical protein J4U03_gp138 [Mycobacterium phage Estes]QNL30825.1 hypothetical protein SEA_ESTES_137 [Mycobacterium phage Estes]